MSLAGGVCGDEGGKGHCGDKSELHGVYVKNVRFGLDVGENGERKAVEGKSPGRLDGRTARTDGGVEGGVGELDRCFTRTRFCRTTDPNREPPPMAASTPCTSLNLHHCQGSIHGPNRDANMSYALPNPAAPKNASPNYSIQYTTAYI